MNDFSSNNASSDERISSAPFPFDANLNHISYMTCPMAGKPGRKDPVDSGNPFYGIRAGAYDNLAYTTMFRTSSLLPDEQSRRLQAGVGLSAEFLKHVKAKFLRDDADIVRQALAGTSKAQNYSLTMALINEDRSRMQGGFGWDYQLLTPMSPSLTSAVMVNYLSNLPRNNNSGTLKKSFFAGLDPAQRAISGSLSWGQSEVDRDNFNSQLRSNLTLTLGYMDSTLGGDITQLASPDSDPFKTVYGKGYRLLMSTNGGHMNGEGFHIAPKAYLLNGIEETNMATKPIQVLNSSTALGADTGRKWDCFSLAIVRHHDRIDYATGRPMVQCRNPITGALQNQYTGSCDAKTAAGTLIRGVRRICPVQSITSLNAVSSLTTPAQQLNMLRLTMARRVLPAEYWEINTDSNYLCAVPTEKATTKGQCYSSGDEDQSKYIQYDLNQAGQK
ncbi:MAG: hypothetical protein ACK5P7_06950, partial [Bdellovibrio sp.]